MGRVKGWMVLGGLAACTPSSEEVTYHRDVRPLLEQHCVNCHSEGETAPFVMDLDAEAWVDGAPDWVPAAVAAIEAGTMPPWMPDEADCQPLDDSRALPAADKELISTWAAGGYVIGDPDSYEPPELPSTERVPDTPADLVLTAVESYLPDATRPDDYHCTPLDYTFEQDTWVRGFTVRPDQVHLVHHVIVYRLEPEDAYIADQRDAAEEGPGYTCFGSPGTWNADTMVAWAPGQNPEFYDEGVARRITAGSKLVIQVHYNTLGATEERPLAPDATAVELWTLPPGEVPEHQLVSLPYAQTRFAIPPGEPRHQVEYFESLSFLGDLPFEIRTIGVMPHMHQLGRRIRADLLRGSGGKQCLVDIPDWDFNWQQTYFFDDAEPVIVGAGDSVRLRCIYDNSVENQPVVNGQQLEPRTVGWGDGSLDEMCLIYFLTLVPPGLL
jgi:hypothetical protein